MLGFCKFDVRSELCKTHLMLEVFEGFTVRDDHRTCNGVRHRTSRGHFEVHVKMLFLKLLSLLSN